MKLNNYLLLLAISLFILPAQILAKYCACCSEKGQYTLRVGKLSDYETGELKRLKIAETTLFTDAGYPDNIKGITPLSEIFTSNFSLMESFWKFNFTNDKNNSGALNLTKAPTYIDFRADIHDSNGEGDPLLYKEIRFKYKVKSGAGMFQTGIVPNTEYFLVFQGRGNNCMNAEDFTHWRLEITGKKADYAFFGKLKTIEK